MRKIISGLIIIFILMTNVGFAADLPSSWAEEGYYYMYYSEILGDDLSSISLLNNAITREEFAELTVRVYAASKNISIDSIERKAAFVDTRNPFVEKAHFLGIVNGVDATHFEPSSNVTREAIAAMLTRMMKELGVDTSYVGNPNISDDALLSSWARDAMYFCRLNEILNGVGTDVNGKTIVAPKDLATRQQSIVLSFNLMKKYGWITTYGNINTRTFDQGLVYDDVSDSLESFSTKNGVGLISNPIAVFKAPPNIERHHYLIYRTALANGMTYKASINLVDKVKHLYDDTRKFYQEDSGYINGVSGSYRSTPYTGSQIKIQSDGVIIIEFIK